MGAIGGGNSLFAYTTSDLTSAGWTQVTSNSITGINDNYYVLVDANSSNYVMSNDASHFRPCYKTIDDPVANPSFVWILEGSDNKFYLKSASTGAYIKQADGWNTSVGYARDNRKKITAEFTLSDGKYSLKCIESNSLIGHWNDNGAAVAADGENIAANKAAANAPGFYLYSIPKATYDAALVSSRSAAVSAATKASPVEVTSWIQNADFSNDWGGWESTFDGSGNMQWTGSKAFESWNATNVVVKQELVVPNGLYKFIGDVISGPGATKAAYLFATGDATVNSVAVSAEASAGNYGTMSSEVAGNTLTADNVYVSTNAITIGMNQSTGWVVADNFKLYYYGPSIKGDAVKFTTGDAVTAGQWYYFDVAAAGNYQITTTDELTNIVYTTDGTILIEDEATVTTNPTAVTALTSGRIYFKSSNAATITIVPDAYAYEVNAPTASIADASYIQSLTTISFDFSSAATTNDPDATFALLNGSATASLKLAGSEVATGALSLDGKVLTATFSELSLTQASTYTVEVAADVVGYEGQVANAAISTSFKTGVIANGVYYFKKNDADIYITRGGWYGTEAVADNFGLSFEATLQSDGTYTLKNIDHSLAANAAKYLNGSGSTYTDQGAFNWTIEATAGGYYLRPSSTEYMAATAQGEYPYSYLSKTTDASAAYVWSLLSKSEYAATLAAAKNAQAAAIATAAGISATTVAELESALVTDYGATDMTSSITNAALTANMDGWTQVKYNGVTYKDADANGTTAEIWNSTGGVKQDITSLPAGIYKVTVVATWRPGNKATATRVGAEANTTAWMYANTGSETNITQLKGWYEGGSTINSRADLVSSAANYINTTYVYVGEGETLTIGLASPSFCVEPWFPFYNWTLTRFEAKATEAEKQALAEAITDAETYTLGFEAGEYAPYTNVDAIEALAAARAIVPETASGEAVRAATTALTTATWTANTTEVNAIYGGDFTKYETVSGQDLPYGWNLYNTGNNSRIMGGTEGASNVGLSAASSGKALLMKFNATYGESEGYTMPLKAGKVYKITFKYGGWGNTPNTIVSLTDPDDDAITLNPNFKPATNDAQSDAAHWYDYEGYFASTTDGDYKLNFTKEESGQQQIVIADIELMSAEGLAIDGTKAMPTYAPGTYSKVSVARPISAAYNTLVVPFAITEEEVADKFGEGAEVCVVSSYDKNKDNISLTVQDGIEANKPVILKATTAGTSYEFTNKTLEAAAAEPKTEGAGVQMVGTYAASIDVPIGNNNFIINGDYMYYVDSEVIIRNTRAYIQLTDEIEGAKSRLSFSIVGDEATGIDAVEGGNAADNGAIYNLSGQRVGKDYKGIVIKNGKKVMMR